MKKAYNIGIVLKTKMRQSRIKAVCREGWSSAESQSRRACLKNYLIVARP